MTNAEKYLKDGISAEEFIEAYLNFSFSRVWGKDENSFENITKKFFEQEVKPQLTEDERVILRNISYTFNTIKRNNFGWLELYDICVGEWKECQFKDELFQFIENGEEYEIAELLKGEL